MKKISTIIFATFLPLAVRAQNLGNTLLENTGKNSGYATGGGDTAIATIVGNVISTFISILGILFLLYTLYGGYIWLIARGNEEKVNTAKDTLKNGIIGLIIVLSAYAISYFIIDAIKGKTLTP